MHYLNLFKENNFRKYWHLLYKYKSKRNFFNRFNCQPPFHNDILRVWIVTAIVNSRVHTSVQEGTRRDHCYKNIQFSLNEIKDLSSLGVTPPNATYVQYRIHKTLSALEKWCSKWRIKLNAKKTQLIVLKKNGRQHKTIKLQLFREEIHHVEEATLLGVTITKTFNFQSHIKMAISKANRRLNFLRLLSGTNWGCKPKIIMQLYKQYVRPVLENGAIAFLSAPKTKLEKIQLVQNKAIKIACCLPWCTSTRKIHQVAEIEPIKNRFQSLANKFIHSLEEHSELFKLQKDLHNAIKKRDKTNFLDELLENYKKQYGNENGM